MLSLLKYCYLSIQTIVVSDMIDVQWWWFAYMLDKPLDTTPDQSPPSLMYSWRRHIFLM